MAAIQGFLSASASLVCWFNANRDTLTSLDVVLANMPKQVAEVLSDRELENFKQYVNAQLSQPK